MIGPLTRSQSSRVSRTALKWPPAVDLQTTLTGDSESFGLLVQPPSLNPELRCNCHACAPMTGYHGALVESDPELGGTIRFQGSIAVEDGQHGPASKTAVPTHRGVVHGGPSEDVKECWQVACAPRLDPSCLPEKASLSSCFTKYWWSSTTWYFSYHVSYQICE